MCRNIRPLFNVDPPASDTEIRDAALQFVRKISGFHKPSQVNEPAFQAAIDAIAATSGALLHALSTKSPPRQRGTEARERPNAPRRSAT